MTKIETVLAETLGSQGSVVIEFINRVELMSKVNRAEIDNAIKDELTEAGEAKTIVLAWGVLDPHVLKIVKHIADQFSNEGMYFYTGIQLAILEILINAVWVSELKWQRLFKFVPTQRPNEN